VHVLRANSVSDELRDLWDHAIKRLKNHRGGPELYTTIRRDVDEESLLTYVVTSGALWTISDEKRVLGFALVRDEVVEGVFVHHEQRRQRVATTLLRL